MPIGHPRGSIELLNVQIDLNVPKVYDNNKRKYTRPLMDWLQDSFPSLRMGNQFRAQNKQQQNPVLQLALVRKDGRQLTEGRKRKS